MRRKVYYLVSSVFCLAISLLGTIHLITLTPTTPQEVKNKTIVFAFGIALTVATTVWFADAMNRFLQDRQERGTRNDSAS